MEKQIREINRELNDFDISRSNERGVATTHNEVHVANSLHETSLDLPSATEAGFEDGASHVDHLYSQNPSTNKNLKPDTQASSIGRVCKEGLQARTWTKVARATQRVEECSRGEVALSSKRTMMEVDNGEVPKKRKVVA